MFRSIYIWKGLVVNSMMKVVEKVNYQTSAGRSNTGRRTVKQPSFYGKINPKLLEEDMKNLMPNSFKMMNRLAKNMGEVQNIVLNALATGLVAPIFIKWNPLSKTDEDTRTYSAWRQPISAVLAVVTQAGITIPFNKLITNMSNSGYLGEKYNSSAVRDDDYIEKLVKKESPYATKEQLTKRIAAKKAQQTESIMSNLLNKNVIMLKNYKGETVPMSKNEYKNLLTETVNDMLKDLKETKNELKITSKKRKIRAEFLRTHSEEVKKVLNEINEELYKPNSVSDLKTYLSKKIKELKSNKTNPELIQMVKEIAGRAPATRLHDQATENAIIKAMRGKVTKMLGHTATYANAKTAEEAMAIAENSIKGHFEAVENAREFFTSIKKSIAQDKLTVAEIKNLFIEKYQTTKNELLNRDFPVDVVERLKKNISSNLKGFKQITGIIVSCAMLPFTCALLNWVYPIFMDAVFPNLSNKKHDNEASALVAKAPKKVEVSK